MARLGKLKVHRATSQTISSYSGRFSTDILFSLVSFVFRVFFFFFLFGIKNTYSDIHLTMWAGK